MDVRVYRRFYRVLEVYKWFFANFCDGLFVFWNVFWESGLVFLEEDTCVRIMFINVEEIVGWFEDII